jgi:hypothetical protein
MGTTTCTCLQVKEILVEESNVQPVNTPVTVGLVLRHGDAACRSVTAAAACLTGVW